MPIAVADPGFPVGGAPISTERNLPTSTCDRSINSGVMYFYVNIKLSIKRSTIHLLFERHNLL